MKTKQHIVHGRGLSNGRLAPLMFAGFHNHILSINYVQATAQQDIEKC